MNKRAEAYIDTVIIVIVCLLIIFINLNIFNYIVMYQKTSNAANQIIKQVALSGEISGASFDEICTKALKNEGLDTSITVDCSLSHAFDAASSSKIQYGDKITIKINNETSIKLMGKNGKRVLPITVIRSKPSGIYWKQIPEMELG